MKSEREAQKRINEETGYYINWQKENKKTTGDHNRYRRMNKDHRITTEEWNNCLTYFNNSCAYCGISEKEAIKTQGQKLHKEHVDHDGANDLSNAVPSCKSCNSSKHTSDIDLWYVPERVNFYSKDKFNKIMNWIKSDHKEYIKPIKEKRKYTKKDPKWFVNSK